MLVCDHVEVCPCPRVLYPAALLSIGCQPSLRSCLEKLQLVSSPSIDVVVFNFHGSSLCHGNALLCSGFDNFYYMYSYEDTRDAFAMPHDILILEQVFRCKDGVYAHSNSYWTATYIHDMIAASGASAEKVAAWTAAFAELKLEYDALARIVDEVSKGIPV